MSLNQINNSYLDSHKNFLRSLTAKSGAFRPVVGVVEIPIGHEDHAHISMTYMVRLLDYGESSTEHRKVRCRRLVPQASVNGVGEYYPLSDGDPVIVLFKEGSIDTGLIIGSFYTEGNLEDFMVNGDSTKPAELNEGGNWSNQPSIHPDRIAMPDAYVKAIGGSINTSHLYSNPSFGYTKDRKRELSEYPVSIEIRNKLGDVAQWTSGSNIMYSDEDIIMLSLANGVSKCARLERLAQHYKAMAKTFKEVFIREESQDVEDIESIDADSEDAMTYEDFQDISYRFSNQEGPRVNTSFLRPVIRSMTNGKEITNREAEQEPSLSSRSNTLVSNTRVNTDFLETDEPTVYNQLTEPLGMFRDVENKEESEDGIERQIQKRLEPYMDGYPNPDHLQYATIEYHIEQMEILAELTQIAAETCVETSTTFNNTLSTAMNASATGASNCGSVSTLGNCNIDLEDIINGMEEDLGYSPDHVSVIFNEESFSYKSDEIIGVASLIKLQVAHAILYEIDQGSTNFEDTIEITSDIIAEYETNPKMALGQRPSIRECLQGTLVKSGNTSSNALVKFLGGRHEPINNKLEALGYSNTQYNAYLSWKGMETSPEEWRRYGENSSTTSECNTAIYNIHSLGANSDLNPELRSIATDYLKQAEKPSNWDLPANIVFQDLSKGLKLGANSDTTGISAVFEVNGISTFITILKKGVNGVELDESGNYVNDTYLTETLLYVIKYITENCSGEEVECTTEPSQTVLAGHNYDCDAEGNKYGHRPVSEVNNNSLVSLSESSSHKLVSSAAQAMDFMLSKAKEEGVNLEIKTSFRSVEEQRSIFEEAVQSSGKSPQEIARTIDPPGFSLLHNGRTVIFDLGDTSSLLREYMD